MKICLRQTLSWFNHSFLSGPLCSILSSAQYGLFCHIDELEVLSECKKPGAIQLLSFVRKRIVEFEIIKLSEKCFCSEGTLQDTSMENALIYMAV